MKTDLLINATALNLLTCARHYQVEAAWGYRDRGPEASFGLNFHDFAKELAIKKRVDLLSLKVGSDKQFLQLCAFYQAMNPLKDSNILYTNDNLPCIEYQFLVPYKESDKYRIFLCGTIDHIDLVDNCIRVIDHKTARSTKMKEVLREYESHIQIPWYIWILKTFLKEYFPINIRDLLSQSKIYGQYQGIFISFAPSKFEFGNRIVLTPDAELDIKNLLDRAIQNAISIHDLGQQLAPPEGMAAKVCKYCFLNNLCITRKHEHLITYLRSQTPEPYDPRTWH